MNQSKIILILLFGFILEIVLKNLFFATIFLLIIIFIFYRNHKLTRERFVCKNCGRCCRLKVEPSREDIKRIKKAGYKDFLIDEKYMKKVNGHCIFLKTKKGISSCTINKIKPELCKKWPISKGIFGKTADIRCKRFIYPEIQRLIKRE